jgi:uncharacterized membrane protein
MKKRGILPFLILILLVVLGLYFYKQKEHFETTPGTSPTASVQTKSSSPGWVGLLILIFIMVIIGLFAYSQFALVRGAASGSGTAATILGLQSAPGIIRAFQGR